MAVNLDAPQFQLPVAHLTVVTPQQWQPNPAYRDQTATKPTKKVGVVIHYPGYIGNNSTIFDVVESVRKGQLSYRNDPNRGYDYGYNYVVDQTGRVAVVRGLYKSAANGTTDSNNWYLAIQIAVDRDHGLTAAQTLSVQRIIHHLRTVEGYDPAVIGHRNVKGTACPGDPIYAVVKAGGFEPKPETWPENQPPPTPPPPPIEEEPLRILILQDVGGAAILIHGYTGRWLDPARYNTFHFFYPITDEPATVAWLKNVTMLGPLPPGVSDTQVWGHQPDVAPVGVVSRSVVMLQPDDPADREAIGSDQ